MSTLYEKGLRLSKNAVFNVFVSRAAKLLGKPFKVITALNEVAEKLTTEENKDNKFKQLFDTALTLVRLVRRFVSGEYREVRTGTIVSGLAVLLYVLSPVDLVPDFIPVLGFLDDLSLISWFVGKFSDELSRFRTWEQQAAAALPAAGQASAPAHADPTQPSVAQLGHS